MLNVLSSKWRQLTESALSVKRSMDIFKGAEPSWLVSKRKLKFDAVSEEVKR